MKRHIARTLKWVLKGGLCGFIIIIAPTSYVMAADALTTYNGNSSNKSSMTVLKEWTPQGDVNGDFEADRRAWLASLRQKKITKNPNSSEIVMEQLDDTLIDRQTNHEFSRGIPEEYITQVQLETGRPD